MDCLCPVIPILTVYWFLVTSCIDGLPLSSYPYTGGVLVFRIDRLLLSSYPCTGGVLVSRHILYNYMDCLCPVIPTLTVYWFLVTPCTVYMDCLCPVIPTLTVCWFLVLMDCLCV